MPSPAILENLTQDLKFAARNLRRSPGFTATAILALALGIGANTAVFTVVNKVLLQPLSYPRPDRIVELFRNFPQGRGTSISLTEYNAWRDQRDIYQFMAIYDFGGPGVNITGGDRPEQIKGAHASAGYFDVFGAPIALGRTYTADEDRPGGPNVAVISNALWRSRFGSDPQINGRQRNRRRKPAARSSPASPYFSPQSEFTG